MAQDHSFDLVSKVNLQEVRNAIQQAQKEIATRFDFKGSSASVAFEEPAGPLKVTADHQAQLNSVIELVETRLAKRGVSLKAFAWNASEQLPSGSMKRDAILRQGLSGETAKDIVKTIKALGLKVQPSIQGETVRVAARQIDELHGFVRGLLQ